MLLFFYSPRVLFLALRAVPVCPGCDEPLRAGESHPSCRPSERSPRPEGRQPPPSPARSPLPRPGRVPLPRASFTHRQSRELRRAQGGRCGALTGRQQPRSSPLPFLFSSVSASRGWAEHPIPLGPAPPSPAPLVRSCQQLLAAAERVSPFSGSVPPGKELGSACRRSPGSRAGSWRCCSSGKVPPEDAAAPSRKIRCGERPRRRVRRAGEKAARGRG